ncbi:hypothetical protein [Maricaulis sp.]|uniref:hypothetical protein n=1 Tax=Maricaulis sp. TaxID=1486257 RepID=UPI0025BCD440|nr:hypothetical protein [Maricaulis sp.]
MPEPLKNFFSPTVIAHIGDHIQRNWPAFDRTQFIHLAQAGLDDLELKQRANQIRDALDACLPPRFEQRVGIILASLHPEEDVDLATTRMDERGIRGWAIMPLSDLVGRDGHTDLDLALEAQRQLTGRFSSEFGIRHLILADPKRAIATITGWTRDPNYHVRRLASEGTRPRLPWAMQLPGFIADPTPTLPILEALRDDPSEYVRRSVANHINDIAKDHPDLAADLARTWMRDANGPRRKLLRHACRSLIKAGHPVALEIFGYRPAALGEPDLRVLTPTLPFPGVLEFAATLRSDSAQDQLLAIDYVLHFQKANGRTAPKVFKLKSVTLPAGGQVSLERRHPIRPITTRRYYPGLQGLSLQINGAPHGHAAFELVMQGAPVSAG